jgi:hypothetical protein
MSQEEKHEIFANWTSEQRKKNLMQAGYSEDEVSEIKGYSELMGGSFYEGDESKLTSPGGKPKDIMADNYAGFRKFCYQCCWNNSTDIESGFGELKGKIEKYLDWDNTVDLWVLDHGHNDRLDGNYEDYSTMPKDIYDRNYFLGAMNFIIKKILDFNPRARIVIIGHYDYTYYDYKWICDAQEILAKYWDIPIYKTWEFSQMAKSRVITTNAYWDSDGVWHKSGFDGTNGLNTDKNDSVEDNPRQLEDGTWVHDISMLNAWMKDSLHPKSKYAQEYYGKNIGLFIKNNLFSIDI